MPLSAWYVVLDGKEISALKMIKAVPLAQHHLKTETPLRQETVNASLRQHTVMHVTRDVISANWARCISTLWSDTCKSACTTQRGIKLCVRARFINLTDWTLFLMSMRSYTLSISIHRVAETVMGVQNQLE